MRNSQLYLFVSIDMALGEASFRPSLPFTLIHQQKAVSVSAVFHQAISALTWSN